MKKVYVACLVSAFALATPAHAQSADPQTSDADAAPGGDIVVTATRDKSQLSKTPIAMSAITGNALRDAGVINATALNDVAPGISIDRTNGLQVTIRGVTSTDTTEKGDPSAAFMLDGVYIARPQEADVSFFDIERVEVLRGPQGTLYGRNTTAGVINVLTVKPKLDVTEGAVNLGYGNYNAFNADAVVNAPLGDKVAVRAGLSYDRHDSYVKLASGDTTNVDPQRENLAARLQVLVQPVDNLTILLRGEYAKIRGSQAGLLGLGSGIPLSEYYTLENGVGGLDSVAVWNGSKRASLGHALPTQPGIGGNGTKLGANDDAYSAEVEVNWDAGPLTVTDVISYRDFTRHETQYYFIGANWPATEDDHYRQFSNELRVSTNGTGPLKVQAGAYYFKERETIDLNVFGLTGSAGSGSYVYGFHQDPVINRTLAGFAQATYKIVPSVRLTAGLRYTDDYKYRYGYTVILATPSSPMSTNAGYVNDAAIKATKLTWRTGVDADVPGGLAYGSVATGYKAGGFGDGCSTGAAGESNVTSKGESCVYGQPYQPGASPEPTAVYYQPETLTAYEIGYKGKFFGGLLRLNAAAFYYDYKNLQLSGVVNINGTPSLVTTNAGKASVKGLELEMIVQPDHNNRLTMGLDLLDAHYTQYCPHYDTSNACDDDWAGRKLDRSPSTTFRAAYTHTQPVGDGTIDATVSTRVTSRYFVTAFFTYPEQFVTPTHSTTDVTVTYHAPGDTWYIQGYAKNLENFITVNGVNGFGGITAVGDPRTFGARAGVKF